ncbi:MAG: serine/threonine protein kinase [bacterium]|nr:serine/threonine protein kinase [bacterium]
MEENALLKQRYEIKEILGRGGFATTSLALDTQNGQLCAIKCLSFRKLEDWKTWELFEREAKILKHLDHPQIPAYLDFFTQESEQDVEIYLVQEYIEGKSLAQLVQEGKHFTETESIRLALELLRILEYLHTLSPPIIHRDIKPGNVALSKDRKVYLIDFGAVKDSLSSDYARSSGVPTVVGSYGYMPLEQFEGRALPASDIYSLGMTLINLLSGKEPGAMEKKGLELDFRPHVNISDPFAKVLAKMIAPDCAKRYQNASQLKQALEALSSEKPAHWLSPRRKIFLLVFVVLLVEGVTLYMKQRRSVPPAPSPIESPERVVAPVLPTPAPKPDAPLDDTLYSVTGYLLFDGKSISKISDAVPELSFLNQTSKKHETPEIDYNDGVFHAKGLFAGSYSLSVDLDANAENPPRHAGDFMKWGVTFDVPTESEILIDVAQVIRMTAPRDNTEEIVGGSSGDCVNLNSYDGPITFRWESLGEGVRYNYLVGTVDCVEHFYSAGSVVNEYTTDTEVTLELPPNEENFKYSFHIFAEKDGRQIGRLYVNSERSSNWNYDFQVLGEKPETPPQQETTARPVLRGRLRFDGRPITDFSSYEPTFWFRNEDSGKEQSARVKYENGRFEIYGLPPGNFGISVNLDANMENAWSYPGDFRTWKPFSVVKGKNPDMDLEMLQIIRLSSPQDNNSVMEKWGAECMEKINFRSPLTFRWEPLADDVYYDYQITRMNCLDNYNSAGTVAEGTIRETEVRLDLPSTRKDEVYGLHLYARKEGKRIGMLITHGSSGYGWDYRFRVE